MATQQIALPLPPHVAPAMALVPVWDPRATLDGGRLPTWADLHPTSPHAWVYVATRVDWVLPIALWLCARCEQDQRNGDWHYECPGKLLPNRAVQRLALGETVVDVFVRGLKRQS